MGLKEKMVLSSTIIHPFTCQWECQSRSQLCPQGFTESPGNAIASFLVPAQKVKRNHSMNKGVRILLPKNRDTSLPAMLVKTSSLRDEAQLGYSLWCKLKNVTFTALSKSIIGSNRTVGVRRTLLLGAPLPQKWGPATSRVGVYKSFTSLSEIERKFFVSVGILEKGR